MSLRKPTLRIASTPTRARGRRGPPEPRKPQSMPRTRSLAAAVPTWLDSDHHWQPRGRMPYATNHLDGVQIFFEDDGGAGVPVVLHGGLLDSVEDVRESSLARSLTPAEFRMVYVDHRGLGR